MSNPSLLDHLGALREQRANETITDLPLPGFEGRLWGSFRLPDPAKASRIPALIGAGSPDLLDASMDLLAKTTRGLYLADANMKGPIHDPETGALREGFQHLPGGTDEIPISFTTPALERIEQLCPPRAHGREHTAETRVRSLFGRDQLVSMAAMGVVGWALGSGGTGALDQFSEQFRNGDEPAS